jgi:GNAT superfamily N-acetyltransferase
MWAHSHLIRVEGIGYSQIIQAENADVCRSYGLCLQAATDSDNEIAQGFYEKHGFVRSQMLAFRRLLI